LVAADDRRTVHLAASGELPEELAGVGFHTMDPLITPTEDHAIGRDRRGGIEWERPVLVSPEVCAFGHVGAAELILHVAIIGARAGQGCRTGDVRPSFDLL
jgi:hypothetical protein